MLVKVDMVGSEDDSIQSKLVILMKYQPVEGAIQVQPKVEEIKPKIVEKEDEGSGDGDGKEEEDEDPEDNVNERGDKNDEDDDDEEI